MNKMVIKFIAIFVILLIVVILYNFIKFRKISNLSFKFFLYTDNEIDNFFDYIGVYSKEIFDVLKYHPNRVLDPNQADIFITCFSNETNYPIYDKTEVGAPNKTLTNKEMIDKCCYLSKGYHLTFFHDSNNIHPTFLNIPYMSESNDAIILCPPAPAKLIFKKNVNRHITASFKGTFSRVSHSDKIDYRNNIINKLQKYSSNQIIIENRDFTNLSYKDLLYNSVFSFVIEGDLPWSYRLTEVINSGSIPIIILPRHQYILPFQQILDYSTFSILLSGVGNEIDYFFTERLPNMDLEYIQTLQDNLYIVNKEVFLNRATQLNALFRCIDYKIKEKTFFK
jgi:hypothetical protein